MQKALVPVVPVTGEIWRYLKREQEVVVLGVLDSVFVRTYNLFTERVSRTSIKSFVVRYEFT